MTSNTYLKLIVVSCRGLYLAHYFLTLYLAYEIKNVAFADDKNLIIADENIGEKTTSANE